MTVDIIQGECIEVMQSMEEASIDLIYADPPYFLSGKPSVRKGKAVVRDNGVWDVKSSIDDINTFNEAWISQCLRLLREGGSFWISGTTHNIFSCGVVLLRRKDITLVNDVTWVKTNPPPNLTKRQLRHSSEHILWAAKKGSRYTFHYDGAKQGPGYGSQLSDVWVMKSAANDISTGHPTQKPEALLSRIILLTSNQGDTVLDPFAGSGTTLIAAQKHGRNAVGIELDKKWVTKAKDRLSGVKADDVAFVATKRRLW